MAYKVVTKAAVFPVSLNEAKFHLKMDEITADDQLIQNLIGAVTDDVERYLNRGLINQTVHQYFGFWGDYLCLSLSPVLAVESITYTDENGAAADYTGFQLDNIKEPCKIHKAAGGDFPNLKEGVINPIKVVYRCGFGETAADVPQAIKQAILLQIGDYYDNRNDAVRQLRQASKNLLDKYRVFVY